MEENTKSGSFLTESCGRKPTAPTTQNYHFFDAAPKWKADTDSGLSLMVRLVNLSARQKFIVPAQFLAPNLRYFFFVIFQAIKITKLD